MPNWTKSFVRIVDTVNYRIGRMVMYLIFVMMAILLWSSFSKAFLLPSLWTLEMSQFTLTAYYILGGAYSLQLASHVRMDLFYGSWSDKGKAWADAFTVFALIFYLCVLLYGGFSSTEYALKYNERSPTAWRPYLAPIKIIMCTGIFMMLMQAISSLLKDIATIRGVDISTIHGVDIASSKSEEI